MCDNFKLDDLKKAFCNHLESSRMLQPSLPETTYFCIENKPAERPSSLGQPGQR